MLLAILVFFLLGGLAYYITITPTTDMVVVGVEEPESPAYPHKTRLLYSSPAGLAIDIKTNTECSVLVLNDFLNDTRHARLLSREL
jgi:hypothetical protein